MNEGLDISTHTVNKLANNVGGFYYNVQFSNGMYYKGYEDRYIKTSIDPEYAKRYKSEESALGEMNLINNNYTSEGLWKGV